jgi:outer membrane protein assembly factor BamA
MERRVNAVRMKELKYQTNITMKDKLEKLEKRLQQMHINSIFDSETFEDENDELKEYYQGKADAFAESAQWLSDILNSENPNSVSNQPTEE